MHNRKRDIQQLMLNIRKNGFLNLDVLMESERHYIMIDDLIRELLDNNYIEINFDENGITILKEKILTCENENIPKTSNVAFFSSTNKRLEELYQFRDGSIEFSDGLMYFYGRYTEILFRTSLLRDYKIEDNYLTIFTLNSTYIFKLLKEVNINRDILASKAQLDSIAHFDSFFWL